MEAKLTGIVQTSTVLPGEKYQWGGMITPELGGPSHQHFFNARLHMMVDGEENSVSEHEYFQIPMGKDNPYGNVFGISSKTLSSESEAAREANGKTGRFWKVANTNRKNAVGNAPGYKLVVEDSPLLLSAERSSFRKRAAFATKHVWITQFDPSERFASGDYPNQHAGICGVPAYVKQNRPIENEDIVVWHTFGHTHVCKPEDFPIMPVEYAGFTLKPNNFFDGAVALDLPDEKNSQSVVATDCGDCDS